MENVLQQVNLRDQALAVLKYRLISGDLVPGEIYSAAALATELGVSNSPVREAMLTLVNDGLMETVKNRGFRVIPLSDEQRRNVYELRKLIEVPSMAKLASMKDEVNAHRERFEKLAAEIVKAAHAKDIVAFVEADQNFHIGLLSLLGNEQLVTIVDNLRSQTRRYGLKVLSARDELVKSAEDHQMLLDAILSGDRKLVTRVMTEHLSPLAGDDTTESLAVVPPEAPRKRA
ncbi:GntR family transcriptional regulator [Burkholderia multivorans]|uniref:GntR family transcriptional regulator n=1 Tax=Burkholderia multivorans TaxID=87883 RepID=UPI001C249FBD|nr:GntR family transcriptional regulator [Burkholderia multivorans]MBU9366059.1 GntR family transcriptional regulator [Burkholderia multivorans]